MPPSTEPEKDSLAWSKPSDGKFSMKTAYEAVASLSLSHHQGIFKCLHKWKGPERSRSFLWKLFHEKELSSAVLELAKFGRCSVVGAGLREWIEIQNLLSAWCQEGVADCIYPCFNLVKEIHARQGNATWNHIFREANQVADVLAKQAVTPLNPFQVFEVPPECSINPIRADEGHVCFPRGF
ncbi:hypothetical protein HKD37_19G053866 [Glycine soja]